MSSNSRSVRAVPLPEGGPAYVRPAIRVAPRHRWVARLWSKAEWHVWLRWVLVNIVGMVIGVVAGYTISESLWEWVYRNPVYDADPLGYYLLGGRLSSSVLFLWSLTSWTICAVTLALAQFLAIRQHLPGRSRWWLLLSLASSLAVVVFLALLSQAALTYSVGQVLRDSTWLVGLIGGIAGSIIGGAQWLVLRLMSRRAAFWIVANSFVGGVGILATGYPTRVESDLLVNCFSPACVSPVQQANFGILIMGVVGAVVTGFALVTLLRYPAVQMKRQA